MRNNSNDKKAKTFGSHDRNTPPYPETNAFSFFVRDLRTPYTVPYPIPHIIFQKKKKKM